jgi:large subunit ribosomal protein L22
MPYHYSYQTKDATGTARAVGTGLRISTKQSIEIAKYLRGRTTKQAKRLLEEVIAEKRAIPFTRFKGDVAHKAGMAAGRYPVNASREFLHLITGAEHNARFKGLNTQNLIIKHLVAQNAGKAYHYGRYSRREMKNTHIEIVVAEGKEEVKARREKKDKGKA